MTLRPIHELRDPVHGLIRLTDQEMGIVNSQVFQRLRRIRQLAMANLVYPGALHTRFEHSLGTLHIAQRILDHLDTIERIPTDDKRVVRLAALLHDLGHGPFSHVSEYLLDRYSDAQAVGEISAIEKIHEKITVDIINNNCELRAHLDTADRNEIEAILQGKPTRDYRRDIVSSDLDADKMDYLLRDAHFAGVRYGLFDIDKIIDVCRKYPHGKESYLVALEEGIFAVEQLVLAKQYMTRQVHAHRIRTITDSMIVRGLEVAIEDGHEAVHRLFSYDGTTDFLNNYLEYDDNALLSKMMDPRFQRSISIFERLKRRTLYKEVVAIRLDELDTINTITRGRLISATQEQLNKLQEPISHLLDCKPWEVIVLKKSIRHPVYKASAGLEPEGILVLSEDGTPRAMSEFPDLISSKVPITERLHIIAPVQTDSKDHRRQGSQVVDSLGNEIRQLIEQTGGIL